MTPALKLNLGCGRRSHEGWVNLDRAAGLGIDVVADLEACRTTPLPFPADSVGEFLLSHVIEHIADSLALMQELYRIAIPGAVATILVPFGTSDDAWEDPTHVRPYFPNSFLYFGQPNYWRADYGYRGDWLTERVHLIVESDCAGLSAPEIMQRVRRERNVVREMAARLVATKPMRPAAREHMARPELTIEIAEN